MKTNKVTFDVIDIDAVMYHDSWIWNAGYTIGHFSTKAKDEKKAFARYLKSKGISFKLNRTIIDVQDGGSILEIQDRKTKEPLFAAIYREQI